MTLDTATLATVAYTFGITLTLNLTLLCLLLNRPRPLVMWSIAFWALILGSMLENPPGVEVTEQAMLLPSNGLNSAANALLLMGFAEHVGYPLRWRWPLALVAATFVMFSMALISPAWWELRVLLVSVNSIVWDAWIVWLLLMRTPHGLRASAGITAFVFVADMVFYAIRAQIYSGDNLQQLSPWGQTLLATNHLFGTMSAMLLTIGLMTMLAQKMMGALRHAADHDALSGLPNRASFMRRARRAIDQSNAEFSPYVVLLCDLDRFKSVNDRWGHSAGDLALQHFSWVIRAAGLPATALFARYGGEEFSVFLPGFEREQADVFAERLRHMVEQAPVDTDEGIIPMTVSIGAVVARGLSYEEAMEYADEALYSAKRSGRNRVVWSEDVQAQDLDGREARWTALKAPSV